MHQKLMLMVQKAQRAGYFNGLHGDHLGIRPTLRYRMRGGLLNGEERELEGVGKRGSQEFVLQTIFYAKILTTEMEGV